MQPLGLASDEEVRQRASKAHEGSLLVSHADPKSGKTKSQGGDHVPTVTLAFAVVSSGYRRRRPVS